jgi:hypothetical protein
VKNFYNENKAFVVSLRRNSAEVPLMARISIMRKVCLSLISIFDFITLLVNTIRKKESVIFISPNLVRYNSFFKEVNLNETLIVNYHPSKITTHFHHKRVFNIGIFYNIIARVFRLFSFSDWRYLLFISNINRFLLNRTKNVYVPCYHDFLGFSLSILKNRNFKLIEVQHGGLIGYFPYTRNVGIEVFDIIYVDNQRTKDYLENHFLLGIPKTQIILKKRDESLKLDKNNNSLTLIYFSSIELNGFHPVFKKFVATFTDQNKHITGANIIVRLHPRELNRINHFRMELGEISSNVEFQMSKSWKDHVYSSNLLIITPWSSIVEEAYDLGIKSVIIDEFGKKRFSSLIDNEVCFYSENLDFYLKQYYEAI